MPPPFDAVSTANTGGIPLSSLPASHVISGSSDRLLLVFVAIAEGAESVTGITYNGIAMTLVVGISNGTDGRMELWKLVAPDTGTHDIVASFSTSVNAVIGGVSFTGAHQTTPTGAAVTATGSSTAPSVNASSAADEIVADGMCAIDALGVLATVGAGQTQRWNASAGAITNVRCAGSTETGAGTTTMSWTLDGSAPWSIIAVPVKPVSPVLRRNLHGRAIGASSDTQHYPKGGTAL